MQLVPHVVLFVTSKSAVSSSLSTSTVVMISKLGAKYVYCILHVVTRITPSLQASATTRLEDVSCNELAALLQCVRPNASDRRAKRQSDPCRDILLVPVRLSLSLTAKETHSALDSCLEVHWASVSRPEAQCPRQHKAQDLSPLLIQRDSRSTAKHCPSRYGLFAQSCLRKP